MTANYSMQSPMLDHLLYNPFYSENSRPATPTPMTPGEESQEEVEMQIDQPTVVVTGIAEGRQEDTDMDFVKQILQQHQENHLFAKYFLHHFDLFPVEDQPELMTIAALFVQELQGTSNKIQPHQLMKIDNWMQHVSAQLAASSQWLGLQQLMTRSMGTLVSQKNSWHFLIEFCQQNPDVLGCIPVHIPFMLARIDMLDHVMTSVELLNRSEAETTLEQEMVKIATHVQEETVLSSTAEPPELPPVASPTMDSLYYIKHVPKACMEWWAFLFQHSNTLFPLPDSNTPFSFGSMTRDMEKKPSDVIRMDRARVSSAPYMLMSKLLAKWLIPFSRKQPEILQEILNSLNNEIMVQRKEIWNLSQTVCLSGRQQWDPCCHFGGTVSCALNNKLFEQYAHFGSLCYLRDVCFSVFGQSSVVYSTRTGRPTQQQGQQSEQYITSMMNWLFSEIFETGNPESQVHRIVAFRQCLNNMLSMLSCYEQQHQS